MSALSWSKGGIHESPPLGCTLLRTVPFCFNEELYRDHKTVSSEVAGSGFCEVSRKDVPKEQPDLTNLDEIRNFLGVVLDIVALGSKVPRGERY